MYNKSRSVRFLWFSMLFLLAFTTGAIAQDPQAGDWSVGQRVIPAPAAASESLRTTIAGSPAPNLATASFQPANREQWDAFIEGANAAQSPSLSVVEETWGVSIEPGVVAAVNVHRITPNQISPEHADHLFIYIHGGAYVFGAGNASISEGAIIASVAGIPTLTIDYRMPPESPFPAALDDVVAVYREIIKQYSPMSIAMGGTSAGGGLTLAAQHQLKSLDITLPAALFTGTPWSDLTKTGDSLFTNEGIDRILVTYDGLLAAAARLYAGGEELTNPLLSPLYGDFENFPPTMLVSGTRDLFLSDTVRTHRKLRAAGIAADLHVYEGMSHAEYGFLLNSTESQDVYRELAAFITRYLD